MRLPEGSRSKSQSSSMFNTLTTPVTTAITTAEITTISAIEYARHYHGAGIVVRAHVIRLDLQSRFPRRQDQVLQDSEPDAWLV